jgi:hypothetical protein
MISAVISNRQTPHCEGQYVSRRLFNKRLLGTDGSFILGKKIQDKKEGSSDLPSEECITLHAGAAQGVTMGSIYGVHASNLILDVEHPNLSLGILAVSNVDVVSSKLSYIPGADVFNVPRLFYCRLKRPAIQKLALYCDDRAWAETIFPSNEWERLSVVLVDDVNAAALRLSIVNDKVHFERNHPMINPHIGSRLSHAVDRSNTVLIRRIITCAMHFNYHLTRMGPDVFRNVYMELWQLEADFSADFDRTLTPIGENLIEKEPAVLVVDELARFGMTINNRTDVSLYPYLFYFDPSDLEISRWISFF